MLWENINLALREIRRNVLRSALTILGIVIGVAAVITMVTLGRGATAQVTSDITSMGSNLIDIRRGQMRHGPGGARADAEPFKAADVTAIQREISSLQAVAPMASQSSQAIYGNENRSTRVQGTTSEFLTVRDWPPAMGRAFTEGEIRAGKAVCILGETVRKELFGSQDPIGATIRLGKISFKVIGVLVAKGQNSFGNDQDDLALIPLRTLQRRLVGNTDVDSISVSVKDGIPTEQVKADIERLLRERRHIKPGKEDNFHVNDMQELVSMLTSTTRVLTALLSAVAAVSLLVGGIGIMNIMLVSVTERTREIGTRLAIGARGAGCSHAVSGGSGGVVLLWRRLRHSHRAWRRGRGEQPPRHPVYLSAGHCCRGLWLFRRGRRHLRLFSGTKGRPVGSHSGAPV